MDGVPRLSEYNRQFQPWKPLIFASDVNFNDNKNSVNNKSSSVAKGDDRRVLEKTKVFEWTLIVWRFMYVYSQ